jgi:hypothetical protein
MSSTGVEQIKSEREKQEVINGRTPYMDQLVNPNGEIVDAAIYILDPEKGVKPEHWGDWLDEAAQREHRERVKMAGALMAAEIDRLDRAQGKIKEEDPECASSESLTPASKLSDHEVEVNGGSIGDLCYFDETKSEICVVNPGEPDGSPKFFWFKTHHFHDWYVKQKDTGKVVMEWHNNQGEDQ